MEINFPILNLKFSHILVDDATARFSYMSHDSTDGKMGLIKRTWNAMKIGSAEPSRFFGRNSA